MDPEKCKSFSIENAQISIPTHLLVQALRSYSDLSEKRTSVLQSDLKANQFLNNEWTPSDNSAVKLSINIEKGVLTFEFETLTFYQINKNNSSFFTINSNDDVAVRDCLYSFKTDNKATQTDHAATTASIAPDQNIEPLPEKRKRGRPRLNKNLAVHSVSKEVNKPTVKNDSNDNNSKREQDCTAELNMEQHTGEERELLQPTAKENDKPKRYGLRGVKLNTQMMNAVKGLHHGTEESSSTQENDMSEDTSENHVMSVSDDDPKFSDQSEDSDSDYENHKVKRAKKGPIDANIQITSGKITYKKKKRKPGILACRVCNKMLCDYTGVYNHVVRKHSKRKNISEYLEELNKLKIAQCESCDIEFSDSLKLRQHMEIKHTITEPTQCSQCGKSFKNLWSLKSHVRSMHVNGQKKTNLCHLCSAAFKTMSNLNQHIKQTHLRKKDFACKICPKRFCNRPQLKRHSRSHGMDESKRVYCKFCNKSFLFEFNLKRHVAGVHSQLSDNFHCSYCGKGFAHKTAMLTHIQAVHFNLFAYTCDECSASFPKSTMLKTHMISYHGKLNFVLPELPSKNGVYDRTTENMFYCSYCSTGFKHKAKLVEHMHTDHSTAFPHMCSACNQGFLEKSFLNVHNLRVHGIAELEAQKGERDPLDMPSGSGEILQFITTKAGCPSKIIAMIQSGQESGLITYKDMDSLVAGDQTLDSGTLLVEVADGSTTTQYMVEAPDGFVNNNAVVQDISNLLLAAGQTLQTNAGPNSMQEINLVIENPIPEEGDITKGTDNIRVTGGEIITSSDKSTGHGDFVTFIEHNKEKLESDRVGELGENNITQDTNVNAGHGDVQDINVDVSEHCVGQDSNVVIAQYGVIQDGTIDVADHGVTQDGEYFIAEVYDNTEPDGHGTTQNRYVVVGMQGDQEDNKVVVEEGCVTHDSNVLVEGCSVTHDSHVVVEGDSETQDCNVVVEEGCVTHDSNVLVEGCSETQDCNVVVEEGCVTHDSNVVVEGDSETQDCDVVVEEGCVTQDSNVLVEGCSVTHDSHVVVEEGNATQDSNVLVEGCSVTHDSHVVVEEGNATQDSNVLVEGCSVTHDSHVVVEEGNATQDSNVLVEGCSVTHASHVVVEEGNVTQDCNVLVGGGSVKHDSHVVVEEGSVT